MTFQIAFLIDTDVSLGKDTPTNSICLSCIRLLHAFSSISDKTGTDKKCKSSHAAVKWGYKFFSSKNIRSKIEFHNFYDFKLKYFEEFENELQKRLEDAKTHTVNNANRTIKPSQCISKSLTDILSDFNWEKPDITSPVKGRRLKRDVRSQTNIVFLFSNLPKNSPQLKQFSGKKIPDDDVFLDTILPSNLFQEFCHVSRIAFNWVDTECIGTSISRHDSPDIISVQLIEKALSRAGGQLYSLDTIIQRGCPFFADLPSLLKRVDSGSKDVPTRSTSEGLLPTTSLAASAVPFVKSAKLLNCRFTIGTSVIESNLVPTTQDGVHGLFSESLRENKDLNLHALTGKESQYMVQGATTSIDNFTLYGVLQQPTSDWSLTVVSSYLCTSPTLTGNQLLSGQHSMDSLLNTMLNKSVYLVFITESGHLALLEPVTVTTASLSLLAPGCSLTVEKHLMAQDHDLNPSTTSSMSDGSCDDLIRKLTSNSCTSTIYSEAKVSPLSGRFDGQQLERWRIPCCRPSLTDLINKLNHNMDKLDFLSPDESGMLKQLQKIFKQEKQPAGLRDTPLVNNSGVSESLLDNFELPQKGKMSRTSISRAEMILCKSKEVVKERGQREEEGETGKDKQEKHKPDLAAQLADFQSVEEVEGYLNTTYDKVVSGETTCVDVTTQTLVTVVLHYMKQTEADSAQKSCAALLEKCLLQSEKQLREKYLNNTEADMLEKKIREYQLQVVLRLEILSGQVAVDEMDDSDTEEIVEQIVGLLRTLSFVSDPGFISQFLQANVLYNYMHIIPKVLVNIYDELMQPLPECLSDLIGSPNTSGDQSMLNVSPGHGVGGPPSARTRSHGSVGPGSGKPASISSQLNDSTLDISRKARKLVHHPSLSDFGGKRQIVVEKMSKPERKSAKKSKDYRTKRKDKVAKALFSGEKRGTKLERRQSVAVMQRSHKTPKKASMQLTFTSPNTRSPRHKTVAETPNHKQQPGQRFRVPSGASEEAHTQVIEESPEKTCSNQTKDTPTKGKRAKALLRRSFYSAGPVNRSRNMSQYFQLADKIAGRNRQPSGEPVKRLSKLLSAESMTQNKSPDKNSSFLLSQLAASPSPAKRTPRKNALSMSVMESPSRNTRSRASPAVNLFKSPSTRSASKQSAGNNLLSPVSRRQSPRVLCPDSDTKRDSSATKRTPRKSPVLGSVSFGLDSPSHAARKLSMTPTRKSVRAALFAKSPAAAKCQSPSTRGSLNRHSLLSQFASPDKEASKSKEGNCFTNVLATSSSPCKVGSTDKRRRLFSPQKSANSQNKNYTRTIDSSDDADHKIVRPTASKDEPQDSQRTPPQEKKRTTKTPDSFDKWHRRKVRSVQSSPSVNKLHTVTENTSEGAHIFVKVYEPGVQRTSLKRSLAVSPDSSVGNIAKKQRTQEADSLTRNNSNNIIMRKPSASSQQHFGSQGFDVTGSFSLSQKSDASSIEYFSTTNDDVFLTEESQRGEEDMDVSGEENHLTSKRARTSTASGWSSPRFKSSVQSPAKCGSPVFSGGVKYSSRSRHPSGEQRPLTENMSPRVIKSPAGRKYSPNVSAKSLMHLIQSPLVKSPESGPLGGTSVGSPHRKGDKSRRSLKLIN